MKKRLVVCCDGTWNRPDSTNITNIEKIARTIQTDPAECGGVQQQVLYLSGVGSAGYAADRLLGGAFGFGLFDNVRSGYRFLALNYNPGDEVFVFGFSRGAYTARSLVGMIGRVGLLTRESLIADQLPEAVDRYRRRRPTRSSFHGSSDQRFREVHSHPDLSVTFLGVFDTVGALGVPGAFVHSHQFHDVQLSSTVQCARQALAVDEHRMKFEPSLWEAATEADLPADEDPRVRQTWFEGAHSDVGGGYDETGLSDTALGWMTKEAMQHGLVFDERLLYTYLGSGSPARRHDSRTTAYKLLNLGSRVRLALRPPEGGPRFRGHERILDRPLAIGVRVASATATHYLEDEADHRRQEKADSLARRPAEPREWYHPGNLREVAERTIGFRTGVEQVVGKP